ncbi:MAG: DUF4435 domain-containing protein [Candidatus Methanomethylophilaceae archaeon]
MRQYLTSSDIANTASMMRVGFSGTILMVEGVTDSRLYGKFVDRDETRILVAHSKDKVRTSVNELRDRRGDDRIIGIIDSDLDRLKHKRPKGPVFMTDRRDAESMMIASDALDDVLAEYADPEALAQFESKFGSVRDRVMDGAYPVGLLMYVSDRYGLGLSFKDLDFKTFISKRDLSCDIQSMIRESIANTNSDRTSQKYTQKLLREELENEYPMSEVCRGHDLVKVLLLGLREVFGGSNAKFLREGELGGALRLAYDDDVFSRTDLYRDTKEWCDSRSMTLWNIR